jgi:hypothetical protein
MLENSISSPGFSVKREPLFCSEKLQKRNVKMTTKSLKKPLKILIFRHFENLALFIKKVQKFL